jgi:DeoR/GlpR family transcriptional regulator of sugar metabolism
VLKEERQARILEALEEEGRVVAADLTGRLGVSEDTVRRDLRDLAEEGKLRRVRGGALPRSSVARTRSGRLEQSAEAKEAVGRAAGRLVEDGQVAILDGGVTAEYAALNLRRDLRATIVTNSPQVAVSLYDHPGVEVVMVGGTFHKDGVVNVGAEAVRAFGRVRADICLQGIWSLHPGAGITHPNYEESLVKRAMIENSRRVVALATGEKLGTATPFVVAPAGVVTDLVTEAGVPREAIEPFERLGIEVIVA